MPLKKTPSKSRVIKKKKPEIDFSKKLEESTEKVDPKNFRDDIDSKKEFFRLMAEKIKEDSGGLMEEETSDFVSDKTSDNYGGRKVSYYRRALWRYLGLVLILLIAVSYFSLSRLDVVVYADKEAVEDSLNFYAYSSEAQVGVDRAVKASINKIELELNEVFPATGQKNLGGEIIGRVNIVNNYSKNQPLVATTRLLSSDDKLFRIKDTINVPAGASVEVDIYTDSISAEMAIEPTTFTIPGLWAGLQDKIYAESYEKFELKQDVRKFVTQNDIDNAIKLSNQEIIKEAEARVAALSNSSQKNILSIDRDSIKVELSHKLGDETDSFELNIKSVVNIISLSNNDVIDLIDQKLSILEVSQGKSEVVFDSLDYELINFNSARSLAELSVDFLVRSAFRGEEGVISTRHLVNLSEKQIKAYLDGIDGLKSYDLFFRPSFIKRSPIILDRINISYK